MVDNKEKVSYLEAVVSNDDLQNAWLFLQNLEDATAILNSNAIGEQNDRGLVAKYQAALNIVSENTLKKKVWLNTIFNKYSLPANAHIEMDTGKVYLTV